MRLTERSRRSWFHRQGAGTLKGTISNEDGVGGRVRVTREEGRVLRVGWTEMSYADMEVGWLWWLSKQVTEVLYSMRSVSRARCMHWRERIRLLLQDLGALTTASTREFWICFWRVIWDLWRMHSKENYSRVSSERWRRQWNKSCCGIEDGYNKAVELNRKISRAVLCSVIM